MLDLANHLSLGNYVFFIFFFLSSILFVLFVFLSNGAWFDISAITNEFSIFDLLLVFYPGVNL